MVKFLGGPYSLVTKPPKPLKLVTPIKRKRKLVVTSQKLLKISDLKELERIFAIELSDEDTVDEFPLKMPSRGKRKKLAIALGSIDRSFEVKAPSQVDSQMLFGGVLAVGLMPQLVAVLSSREFEISSQ